MGLGIGQRIKLRRNELKLTQEDLAHRMGYKSKAAVCKVEGGEDNITSDRIEKFAKALSCTPAYLMGWDQKPQVYYTADEFELEWHKNGGGAHPIDLSTLERCLVYAFRCADKITQDNICKLLDIKEDNNES